MNGEAAETFLGGRVLARQPGAGYRAALDTVLLGAAVAARDGERVLELGCGSGAALLIAAERNPGAHFVGLELDAGLVELAAANARANPTSARVEIVSGDVLALPGDWRDQFDQVMLNPPFFNDPDSMRLPADPARRAAFVHDAGDSAAWIGAALSCLKARGRVTVVHRADELGALLAALEGRAGEVWVRPIHPKAGVAARRVLVRARKGSRTPLSIASGLVLHDEEGGWTAEAAAILGGEHGFAFEV